MKRLLTSIAAAAAAGSPLLAPAQTSGAAPVTAAASAPALRYQSAFADYKPYQDVKSGDWKAMNDATSKPAMPDHGGHRMPMQGGKK